MKQKLPILPVLCRLKKLILFFNLILFLCTFSLYEAYSIDNDAQNVKLSKNIESASGEKAIMEIEKNSLNIQSEQDVKVTGSVTTADNMPLPGVNVIIKGTTIGTITDIDGNYTINAPSSETVLQFSFIGYITKEITVGEQTQINIELKEDLVGLEEVVVVGYGTMKKSDVTGAISSVTSEKLNEIPVTNISQALQGRAAGVDVQVTSFGLNAKPEIRIRGNRSIKAKNDPLYILDGIPLSGDIGDINAMDIESIEVLKDASATAIYGSRGANGVILITSKKGTSGQVSINFESSVTINNSLRFFDMISGGQWMEVARDTWRNEGVYTSPYANPKEDYDYVVGSMHPNVWNSVKMGYEWNADGTVKMRPTTAEEKELWGVDEVPVYNPDNVRTYDWEKEGRNVNALTQNHQLSVSGGGEKATAYFSLGYINEEGLGIGENFTRISPRLNLEIKPYKWFTLGASNSFNYEVKDPGEGLFWGAANQLPLSTPYDDSTGEFLINPTGDIQLSNPMQDELLNTREEKVARYIGSYYMEIALFKGLKYRLNVGQDYRQWRNGRFRHEESAARYPSVNDASYSQGNTYHYTVDNLLFYDTEFGIHNLNVTLLQSIEVEKMERNKMYAQNLPYSSQLWYDLRSTLDPATIALNDEWDLDENELTYHKKQLSSFMGRINYGLLDKYLLTASLRYDGSSMFYVDNQWDYFPSFAVSWKIHNENFLNNIDFINQLKIRVGYGTVGQTGSSPYETAGRLKESQYVFGDVPAKGQAPSLVQTKEVGWEKTATQNYGLDFGFFENRISGTIEKYYANTFDLLMDMTVPSITGYDQVRANIGKTRNQGIEITLNTVNIHRGDFKWETNFIFMKNKEEIVELADNVEEDIVNRWFVGEPIGSYYDYEYDGIWQVSDSIEMNKYNTNAGFPVDASSRPFQPGKIKIKDTNGDDSLNANDKIVVGNNVPDFSGGVTNAIYFKGFELSAFVYFRYGQGIYSRDGHYFHMNGRSNVKFLVDYYKPMGTEEENADAVHPAPSTLRDNYETALYYHEVSFIKVRHITLSYNVPKKLLSKAKISSMQLSIQAFNPFLFTDYPYLDPEARHKTAKDERNIPGGTSNKGWTFGIKVGI